MNRLEVRTTIEQLLIRVEVGDTGSNPVSRGTIYISDWRSLASASALGAEGRGFESLIRDQFFWVTVWVTELVSKTDCLLVSITRWPANLWTCSSVG